MKVARVSHVPIREPMFVNGMLSQAWIRFFEQLANGVNVSEFVDVVGNAQRSSHELPNMALQGQTVLDVEHQLSVLPIVSVNMSGSSMLEMVAVPNGEML